MALDLAMLDRLYDDRDRRLPARPDAHPRSAGRDRSRARSRAARRGDALREPATRLPRARARRLPGDREGGAGALRRDRCVRGTSRPSPRAIARVVAERLEPERWRAPRPPPIRPRWRSSNGRTTGRRRGATTGWSATSRRSARCWRPSSSGKLHHAWLLTGPRGIGKATLAWRFARFLLAGPAGRPVRRRARHARRGARGAGPRPGRCADASRPVPPAAHASSQGGAHPERDHGRRCARPRRVHAHDAGDGRLAGRHRRRRRRDEPQQRQRDAEGPRGAAAQRRAADRRPCAGTAAADHPLALPPARPAAARRRDRDRAARRLCAEHGAGREEGARPPRRRQHRPRARARRAPAASTSIARWSSCWRPCPSSTCRACTASPSNSARRGEEANADWRSFNYLFDGWLKGLARSWRGRRRRRARGSRGEAACIDKLLGAAQP